MDSKVFILIGCLLVTIVYARGGPKIDLGPLVDENTGRSCADVMEVFDWVSCEEDGTFSALQCDPESRLCFCLHPNGTRVGRLIFRSNRVTAGTCMQEPQCPEIMCQIFCERYATDPRTGCQICECKDEVDCPTADEVSEQCTRDCLAEDDNGCPQCMERCQDGEMDECDSEGRSCPDDGVCTARGRFAERKCLISEIGVDDVCEREEGDSEEDMNARRLLRGVASRRNSRRFRPAAVPCPRGTSCLPFNATVNTCQRNNDTDGPCFDESRGLECDDRGMYRPLQCSGNSCWCVDPENGTEIMNTRVNQRSSRRLPKCTDIVYDACVVVVRDEHYRVDHNRFGLDVSRCRRCLCQDGQLDNSTCVNGRSCELITPRRPQNCVYKGIQYQHRDVFAVDRCNRCKCLNGKITGCTRRKCRRRDGDDDDDEETPCDRCRDMPIDPVCGPNGVTYDNLCIAQFCAGLDPLEVTEGPCSTQDPCKDFPCEDNLTCIPHRITCSTRRGCSPEDYRMCINETDTDCPVDDEDEEVCGSDGVTYPSLCRLLLESDDIYVAYDGPCNQTECMGMDTEVCGTDFVTYDSVCVLRSQNPNVRPDYEGPCLNPAGEDTLETFCDRIRAENCGTPDGCTSVVQPTDGCCPICGGVVSLGVDEDGLSEYAELFIELRSVDAVLERIVGSGTIPEGIFDDCDVSAYITTTNNLEVLYEAMDGTNPTICFNAAAELSEFVNSQGDGTVSEVVPDPVVSFLTAASSLEQEVSTPTGGSGAATILPSLLLMLSIILAVFVA